MIVRYQPWITLLILIAGAYLIALCYTYLGWAIIARNIPDTIYPHLTDPRIHKDTLNTAVGAIGFGILVAGIAFLFPGFRRQWRRKLPRPFLLGMIIFYLLIGVSIVQGFL